ncbi:MAG TPA: hypothetical protein DDX39_08860 [Bacteroidales bacterium]|nr:MAG: hypothetical protein A2W98_11980 [Bacteroidetes bacterium GWF2_33_38]OFY74700.1 MAG: hypothetical protein A2265_01540 [Bacteroidetes bacterium RIFOXYA12_FULL_33_9]HBF88737.1 hypothetical protein [Bacteroidales bacterium]
MYVVVFIFLIYRLEFFQTNGISKRIISAIFILKILSGFGLIFIYTHYYKTRESADIYKYFDDAKVIYSAAYEAPVDYLKMITGIDSDSDYLREMYFSKTNSWYKEWDYHLYNDNRTITRFNALAMLISNQSIYIHTIFMAFLSLIGLLSIYKVFVNYLKGKEKLLIIFTFLLPTVMLWSSGVLKEGILVFAFGIMFLGFYRMIQKFSFRYLLLFSIGIALLSITKFYTLMAAIPGMIALLWIQKTNGKRPFLKFIIVHTLAFIGVISNNYVLFVLYKKQVDFQILIDGLTTQVGSYISVPNLEPTALSFLKNAPIAFSNTFLRPHIFEVYSPVVFFAAAENLLIIMGLVLSLIFINKRKISNYSLLYFSIFFVVIMFILCGLVTPVMGALVRYKMPALPFLFIIFIMIVDIDKIKRFLKKG